MRDAQSMLDQLVAFCGEHIKEDDVQHIFGFTSGETIATLIDAVFKKDTSNLLNRLNDLAASGKNLSQLLQELINTIRALLIHKIDPKAGREGLSSEVWKNLTALTENTPTDRLLALIEILSTAEASMRWAANKQLHLELALIRSVEALDEIRISDVIRTLEKGGLTDNMAEVASPPAVSPESPVEAEAPSNSEATPEEPPTPEPESSPQETETPQRQRKKHPPKDSAPSIGSCRTRPMSGRKNPNPSLL